MTDKELKTLKENLWHAADMLRAGAHMAANQYGQPILGLIFLRYADILFKQHKDEIDAEFARLSSTRMEKTKKEIAIEKCGFFLPECAYYDTINDAPDKAEKAGLVKEAMEAIEQENPKMEGVLPKDVYGLLVPEEEPDLLSRIVRIFKDIPENCTVDTYEIEHKVEKSAIALVGFGKTQLLQPGASETVTVTIDKYLLASYDMTANSGAGGYILSGGDYFLAIGEDAHDALNNVLAAQGYSAANGMTADGAAAKSYKWAETLNEEKYRYGENGVAVSNQFTDCDLNYWIPDAGIYLSRSDWAGTFPVSQTTVSATKEMMDVLDGEWYEKPADAPSFQEIASKFGVDSGLNLAYMKDVPLSDTETWELFIHQLKVEDLPNATAESFSCPAVGELSPSFGVGDGCDSIGGNYPIPVKINGEDVTVPTTRYCSNPIMTGTFNYEIIANRGTMLGEDGMWSNFMINYNIGNDLHRTPFGGRSFEYMSECPTLSYLAGAAEVVAMEKTGSHAAPKHFVGNDQEFYRDGVACFFNEQAFREGNLRAFEGSVRKANAGGIMQSFSRLALKWNSSSYALNTQVLRNEWGWQGAIDTDAAPCFGEYVDGGYRNHAAEVLAAGTQEWCLDGVGGHGTWVLNKARETDDGYLLSLLEDAAISWEYAISRSVLTNGYSSTAVIEHITPWWATAIHVTEIASGVLAALCLCMLVVSKINGKKKEN